MSTLWEADSCVVNSSVICCLAILCSLSSLSLCSLLPIVCVYWIHKSKAGTGYPVRKEYNIPDAYSFLLSPHCVFVNLSSFRNISYNLGDFPETIRQNDVFDMKFSSQLYRGDGFDKTSCHVATSRTLSTSNWVYFCVFSNESSFSASRLAIIFSKRTFGVVAVFMEALFTHIKFCNRPFFIL